MIRPRPLLLVILDGWGVNPKKEANAIALANPPFYNHLLATYPHTTLSASGEDVGLPDGQMGNSEVGHMNMGAGRIVYQDFTRINKAISDRSFYVNPVLRNGFRGSGSSATLHLMGLLSDGGVHSHMDHLMALLDMAGTAAVLSLVVHPFLDGRDTPPTSALLYIKRLESALKEKAPKGADWKIGTVMGRYYAMDRDQRWDRTARAYHALVQGEGNRAVSAQSAIEKSFQEGKTDEFVLPIVLFSGEGPEDRPVGLVRDNDRILFFNFRSDRARQLTRAFTQPDFASFDRTVYPKIASFVTLTQYDKTISVPMVFPPINLDQILAEVLSQHHLKQCRIAETEKYPHVTYFFNGGREVPFQGEERVMIPSTREVATYDEKPEMSAPEVANAVVQQIEKGCFDFMVINFANPDMVGHSGRLDAAIQAVSVIDRCLEKVVGAALAAGGAVLLTSDHGNLEQMIDYQTGLPHTAHTTLPVPLIFIASEAVAAGRTVRPGIHANLAPTILDLLNISKPVQMDQASLLHSP
jgi:2,3-bisphosphoglycerate-independent phosphoglycerate mutase